MGTKNHNHLRSSSWDTERDKQDFLSFRTIFCLFTPLTTQKIRILKKWKKKNIQILALYHHFNIILLLYYYIIILQMCTKNHNHMMYASWDMQCDRHNLLPFWAIFCPITSLITTKIKICKNVKKQLQILLFFRCAA